jgi:hypothetical protein
MWADVTSKQVGVLVCCAVSLIDEWPRHTNSTSGYKGTTPLISLYFFRLYRTLIKDRTYI